MGRVETHIHEGLGNIHADFWVKVRMDDEFLKLFWGKAEQPSLDGLADHLETCVQEWLEGKVNERRNVVEREREFLTRRISPSEFFD